FRATYNKSDRSITGFNFLGIRFRQAIAEDWISKKKTVDECVRELKIGWFQTELSKPLYKDISKAFTL
ncbi:MAG TPA: hypothetical protein VLZ28_03100, partial [Daejeonella sp.]|nr:hypothetical protein [Daejeonella sp.]